MAFVGQRISRQVAFVPSDPCTWTDLKVTQHYISHGHDEITKASIWDRHYGVKIAEFDHRSGDPVNSIAINPVNEGMAVTVSSDMTVKVWRSRELLLKMQQRRIKNDDEKGCAS